MTIVDIKNALFTHLFTSNTFSLADDVASLGLNDKELGETLAQHKVGLVRAALEDMAHAGILVPIAEGVYVLTQPLNAFSQQVVISPLAAEMVADMVNGWHAGLDGPPYTANKMTITTYDIETLCHYLHFMLDEDTQPDPDTP